MRIIKRLTAVIVSAAMVIGGTECSLTSSPAHAAGKAVLKSKSINLEVDQTKTITLKNKVSGAVYTFRSKNVKIAEVSKKGKVTGKKKGVTTVVVKQKKGKKNVLVGNVKVKVTNKAAQTAATKEVAVTPLVILVTPLVTYATAVPANATPSGAAVTDTPKPTETTATATDTPKPTETTVAATDTPKPTETTAAATDTPKPTEVPVPTATPEVKFSSIDTQVYLYSMDSSTSKKLYFTENGDIPYIALEDWKEMVENVLKAFDQEAEITCSTEGNVFSYVRENDFTADFDFKEGRLSFEHLNGFFRINGNSLIGSEKGVAFTSSLYKRDDSSYDRYGSKVTVDFGEYDIDIYETKYGHLLPLQTFSDCILSRVNAFAVYNGEAVFLAGSVTADMSEKYLSAPKRKMSDEFAEFNYNELCLALDYLYGLKDAHDIKKFDAFFSDTTFKELLTANDATIFDIGLYSMISYYFDDMHSNFNLYSYNSEFNGDSDTYAKMTALKGTTYNRMVDTVKSQYIARMGYYPEGIKFYEEVGDTAYITFDSFAGTAMQVDYSKIPEESEIDGSNTIKIMQYACSRILRENSPIKRVVLDLSVNGGGEVRAATYVIGTFLGKGIMTQKDVITGAQSNIVYNIDTNCDGVFDDKDTLAGKGLKLYCFTSGYSFSCGNMVPSIFKDSGKVTLIGRTSGGGSCCVQPLCSASGSIFQISGPLRFSFTKNGSFYDVDRGADANVFIDDMTRLYDREYMNSVLDGLK